MEFLLSFLATFLVMEFVAWFLHKYVMHGFLWKLHEDHHVIRKDRKWQKNDFFALIFPGPSMAAIYFGGELNNPLLAGMGWGIAAYGLVYFIIHEVVIHRRWRFFNMDGRYVDLIRRAHRDHHKVPTKEGASNFGMVIPPLKYLKPNGSD